METLIGQTSDGVVVTDVLLVDQTILISIARIILHLDVVDEVLLSLVLLVSCLVHGSSVWGLVYGFWS